MSFLLSIIIFILLLAKNVNTINYVHKGTYSNNILTPRLSNLHAFLIWCPTPIFPFLAFSCSHLSYFINLFIHSFVT